MKKGEQLLYGDLFVCYRYDTFIHISESSPDISDWNLKKVYTREPLFVPLEFSGKNLHFTKRNL